jgi:4-hydroxybenzoate polyprenyltransferase
MLAFFKLIRYQNLGMVLLTMILIRYALIPSSIENTQLSLPIFFMLAISILSITAGGYIINDVFDRTTDKINKPKHKLHIGYSVSLQRAKKYYALCTIIGILLGVAASFYIDAFWYSGFFFAVSAILFLYAYYLKGTPFLGNLVVAILVSFTIYIVYLFEVNKTMQPYSEFMNIKMDLIVMYYIYFSFLTTLIRELIKDIEDINGDYLAKMQTLPIILGTKRTRNLTIIFTIVLIVSLLTINQIWIQKPTLKWFGFGIYNYLFVLIPLFYFIYVLWNASTKKDFTFLSKFIKMIMFLGIVSMLILKLL